MQNISSTYSMGDLKYQPVFCFFFLIKPSPFSISVLKMKVRERTWYSWNFSSKYWSNVLISRWLNFSACKRWHQLSHITQNFSSRFIKPGTTSSYVRFRYSWIDSQCFEHKATKSQEVFNLNVQIIPLIKQWKRFTKKYRLLAFIHLYFIL